MSMIVKRAKDGQIISFVKGADTIIMERLVKDKD